MVAYLLSETGVSGGVWKTSHMDIGVEGIHHVSVVAKLSTSWNGTVAFTNVVLEEGKACHEGAVLCTSHPFLALKGDV